MKRLAGILFIFLLISQTVTSSLGISGAYSAEGAQRGVFTDVTVVEAAAGNKQVDINVQWSVKDLDIKAGYTESISVPSEVTIASEQNGVLASDNTEVGTYKATTDGTITVFFHEEVEKYPEVEGLFTIAGIVANEDEATDENLEAEEVTTTESGQAEEQTTAETETKDEVNKVQTSRIAKPMSGEVVIEENIIKNFELTLRDGNPLPDPLPNPNENEVELKVRYEFELPESHQYGAGSTYTFNLPEQLKLFNETSGNLGEVGTYVVTKDGKVTITFNENIVGHSEIGAWLEVFTVIDKDLKGNTDQKITVPIKDNQVKEIDVTFEPKKGNSIDKRGTPNQQYNATRITWEIDFNKDKSKLTNAQLLDPIVGNQKFIEGSIKVYALDVQVDGSVVPGNEITDHNFGNEFPLNFGDLDGKAYRVVFETEITDEEGTNYENTATLKSGDVELPAEATVAVSRGKALEKRAADYDSETQTITWEVKYNYNEKNIPQNEAFLLDELSENQELIEDSFEVVEVEIDLATGEELNVTKFENYTVTDRVGGKKGFKFQFNQDVKKAYKIVYKTKASERVYDNAVVTNKVEANGKTETGKQETKQEVFYKYQFNEKSDYENKTKNWGIYVNRDSHKMNNVVVTDTLPKGLSIESYKVFYDNRQHELTAGTHFSYEYDKETGKLTFDFSKGTNPLNPIEKDIYIQYTTKINYNEVDEVTGFKNAAKVTWIAEGETEPRSKEDTATFDPNEETKLNGSKGGTYNAQTKEITWTIGANYNNRDIEEAIVEDLIQGNQNLVLDSIEVHHMKIDPNGKWSKVGEPLEKGTAYTVEQFKENDQPGFRINLGEINSPYVITYKTSLEGELIVEEYNNEAVLKDGEKEFPLTAKVSVNNGGNYTDKEAVQNGENEQILNWTVAINKTQSTISDAQLTDKPSANQKILKDSFVLYGTDVAENGDVTKNADNILEKGKDYTLEFKKDEDGHEYFELKFLNEINKPYILQYDTFLMAGHNETVTNNATVTGEQITDEKTDTNHEHVVKYSASEGGGTPPKFGKLEITKIDAVTKESLEGVEFTLFDKTGKMALITETTDSEGRIPFNKLRFGDYLLKETKVPEGYVSQNPEGQLITIDQEVNETNDAGNTITIENYPTIYEVQLTKEDAEDNNKVLSGATFKLQQKIDGEFKTIKEDLTTNSNGVIHVTDLEAGEFQFVETKAPEGYLLNAEPISFTIEKDALEIVTVTAKNTAIETTSIEGTKSWKDGNSEDRPKEIKVDLLRDGTVVNTADVTEKGNWKYSFNNLPKTDALGKVYVYSVKEQTVDGYKSTVDGTDITNIRVGKTEIAGTKTWKDGDSEDRPESITVKLLQNEKEIDTKEVTAEDNWTYSFIDLDEFDEDGVAYKYTIDEVEVEGYETTIDGTNITNLRVGKTEVTGTKTWKDDNAEADRPESITVNLLQNGEKVASKEVTAAYNWAYTFTDLEAFDDNGVAYEYTVEEEPVKGYETTIDGFDITNVRVATTTIDVTKVWKGDKQENRPNAITVELLQNGKVIDTVEITAEMDWKHTFVDLATYDEQGKAYTYSVEEKPVDGYQSTMKETSSGFEITNTLIEKPEKHEKPEKPTKPDVEPKEPQNDKDKNGKGLPNTATNIFNIILIGAALTIVGLFIFRKRRIA